MGAARIPLLRCATPHSTPATHAAQAKPFCSDGLVCAGDVYFCSGQSNMWFPLQSQEPALTFSGVRHTPPEGPNPRDHRQ